MLPGHSVKLHGCSGMGLWLGVAWYSSMGVSDVLGEVRETLNWFEKHAHNEHNAQGGGSFADQGLAVGSLRQ